MAAGDLAEDIRPIGADGRYRIDLPPNWDFLNPSGGVLMAAALRAMAADVNDPGRALRSATTMFCAPIEAGVVRADITTLRSGRTATQLSAALRGEAGGALTALATFGVERGGPAFVDVVAPDVPEPDECEDFFAGRRPDRRATFFESVEMRLAIGHRWWEKGWEAGDARFARWVRHRVPQRTPDGKLDPIAMVPAIDMMPPAVLEKVGPTHPRFFAPSLDLTVHFLAEGEGDWMLIAGRSRFAGGGYATADIEVYDEARNLLAYATQVMVFVDPARSVVAPSR